MADNLHKPEYWIDELIEKHECFGYKDPVTIPIHQAGHPLSLIAPWPFERRTEILETTISNSGELLYLFARETDEDAYMGFNPILIVARRRGPDQYAVVVWHCLYPWAIERLGLDGQTNGAAIKGQPELNTKSLGGDRLAD